MSVAAAVRAELEPLVEAMAALVAELAAIESPTDDRAALDRMAARLLDLFAPFGAVERFPQQQNGDHFVVRIPGRHELQPALALCHYDTVWPLGSLGDYPVTIADGVMRGPGVFDMKGGIVCLLYALRALDGRPNRPLWLFFNSDEETGSHSSRGLIEELARGCAHALVYESPLPAGALKTARKGTGRYTVAIEGRAAHAGVEPEKGISAVLEAAHQTIAIHALNAPERGSTLNAGVLHGGTRANVVAAHAEIEVDVRVSRADEAQRIDAALRGLRPVLDGARIDVSGGLHRPPMERSAATAALFARARAIAAEMGVALGEGATGGGSDGNFTASLGLGTLDGLGPEGRGAHAANEQLLVESLPRRAALSAGLLDVL
ncbi:MAG TPA: M20 family metallopeptidase [Dehalococcoidia bacterium]|nr:M20 family metallopeptidase [Dehalococcoidia bacterium]